VSLARTLALAMVDLRLAWRRPLWITLTVLLAIFAFGFAAAGLRVQAGDVTAGGKQAWINSQFNAAFVDAAVLGLFLPFFAAIAAGLPLLQDVDRKVDRVLLGTRLTPLEYVLGRFLGAVVPLVAIVAIWVVMQMLFFQLWPTDDPDKDRGPFAAWNYVWPAVVFALPLLLPMAGGSMLLGAWSRAPILVFLLPLVILIGGALFLWNWSPEWLPTWANQALMQVDPSGNRWLSETWLKADRGVDYYNTQPMVVDPAFAISRVAWCVAGVLAVPLTAHTLFRRVRTSTERRLGPHAAQALAAQQVATAAQALSGRQAAAISALPSAPGVRLGDMRMVTRSPGVLAGLWTVLRNELRMLLRSPGVWLFAPLIILQVVGSSLANTQWLGTETLATTGSLATSAFNTLTLLLIFLTLFYTVESMVREERLGFAGLLRASGVRTSSLMVGKILANAGLALVLMAATVVGCTVVLVIQVVRSGIWPPFEFMRFVELWGLVLTPTIVVWCAFVALVQGVVRNRYATWAIGLGVLVATGLAQQFGYLTWVGNWHMWGTLVWSDLDRLEFLWPSIVANRLFVLALAALFLLGAAAVHPRRQVDWQRVVDRIAPRPILRATLRVSPLLALVIGLGIYNWIQARTGFQGAVVERQGRDYWRRNDATFRDVPLPALATVTGSVDIDPFDRSLRVQGTYVIRNPHATPMAQIPLTQGEHYRNLTWTLNGKPMEPMKKDALDPPPTVEDRAGLWVFTPARPLATGETVTIGFSFDGVFPAGWTRNGGGAGEFILPSGVVLTSFSSSFMPMVGFQEGVGVDDRNASDPKEPLPDDWKRQTDPAFGSAWAFDVTMQVTGPEDWTLNCVGIPGEPVVKDGRKTVTWTTDHPVRFFNIAGGPLERLDGEGSTIFHSLRHPWNVKTMSEALDASRACYGRWFGAYPRRDLRLTEFPGLAGYAQGFPGNITFSESIGFLTRPGAADDVDLVFFVTAHEAAHQWWGNMLMPGKGPGGNILSEGLANFSAALLTLEKRGDTQRQRMLRQWEDDYANGRSADSERPMVLVSGTRPGDQTVTYDKGGWVFWMLMDLMGRDRMLAGLQDFIRTYQDGPDYPLLQDFVAVMRRHAADLPAFDAFTRQWFESVVLPEFKLWDLKVSRPVEGEWLVEGTLENVGTGTVSVEVAAVGAELKTTQEVVRPMPEDDPGAPRRAMDLPPKAPDARATVAIGAGERVPFRVVTPFEPLRVRVDPDVRMLQVRRKLAEQPVPRS
jgi:ABC-2 type transport system permease protein